MLLIGVPAVIIDADATEPTSEAFGLPSRTCVFGWQITYGATPGAANIVFQVAMDFAGPWTELDSYTGTADAFITIPDVVAARFGRIDVVDSSSEEVTVSVIAKVAAP